LAVLAKDKHAEPVIYSGTHYLFYRSSSKHRKRSRSIYTVDYALHQVLRSLEHT